MRNTESPLWKQMFSPISSKPELTELRHLLSINDQFAYTLQAFLHSEWQVANTAARIELNPDMRVEHQQYAFALAELAGKLFREEQDKTTTEMPPI